MLIYLNVNEETNRVTGWGSTPFDTEVSIEIDEGHGLIDNWSRYLYVDGEIIEENSFILEKLVMRKDAELNKACADSILGGFDFTINNIVYRFSFDTEAQLNFQGAERLFGNGMIQEVPWTVTNTITGRKERVMINKEMMNQISLLILQHKTGNISKYRDELSVQLKNVLTSNKTIEEKIEEINSITWY